MLVRRVDTPYLLLHAAISVAVFFLAVHFMPVIPTAWEYLIAPTVSAISLMLVDKLAAANGLDRVPERAFMIVGLLGGSLGVLAGMYLFRHKTRKGSFQFMLALVFLVQVAAIAYLLRGK